MESTRYQRIDPLSVDIEGDEARVLMSDAVVDAGPYAFEVLAAFSRPRPLAEVVDELTADTPGPERWMQVSATVVRLRDHGVLVPSGTDTGERHRARTPFVAPYSHISMLDDGRRTRALVDAIADVVTTGDTVLDIGTGTGVLAVAAARAGAGHVYAVDAGVGAWTRAVVAANGMSDRVTVIDGWSSAITLPDPADVLITETIGDDPLGEGILESVIDARRRLLVEDAAIVPRAVRVIAVPVEVSPEWLAARRFGAEAIHRWNDRYGIDFGPLADEGRDRGTRFSVHPTATQGWRRLSLPAEVARIDLTSCSTPSVDGRAEVVAELDGVCHAVAVYFAADLGGEHTLGLGWDDRLTDPAWSWSYAVWLLPTDVPTAPGTPLTLRYRYRVAGVPEGERVTCEASGN